MLGPGQHASRFTPIVARCWDARDADQSVRQTSGGSSCPIDGGIEGWRGSRRLSARGAVLVRAPPHGTARRSFARRDTRVGRVD